jgi:hypothetical protein
METQSTAQASAASLAERTSVITIPPMHAPMVLGLLLLWTASTVTAQTNPAAAIANIMQVDHELNSIPFATIIEATTGHKIIPLDLQRETERALVATIGAGLDEVLKRLNATNSAAQQQRRINEVSSHFENELRTVLNATPGLTCEVPRTAGGKVQRSGYPDLRLVAQASGRVIYLDPKLFEQGSRSSSFRTFYYEPKLETSKIHEDAHHLVVGIEHDGRASGAWKFTRWELVDVSRLRVTLKAEFQSSNKELYRPELIVGRSKPPEQ